MPFVLKSSWVGRRVSVRRALERAADGRILFGDVVGDLLTLDTETAVVEGRHGVVQIPTATVAVARLVVPSTADEFALERILARGWQAEHTAELGGWLFRAAGGFTSRANSVLTLAAPGVGLDEALDTARAWYAERGLPLRLQVPAESRRLLDAELGERGWAPSVDVHVLAARLGLLPTAGPLDATPVTVDVSAQPTEDWFTRYRDGAGATPAARGILQRHEQVGFAAIRIDGQLVAIGRGTVDADWLGITAVEVGAEHRRQGLATAIMRALWGWGSALGATRTHLEVASDNAPALALYEQLGYWVHHDYRYRDDPAPDARAGEERGSAVSTTAAMPAAAPPSSIP